MSLGMVTSSLAPHSRLDHLRRESCHSYDTAAFPFLEAVREVFASVLQIDRSSLPDLHHLHSVDSYVSYEEDRSCHLIHRVQNHWNRHRSIQGMQDASLHQFNHVYWRFIEAVIGPSMGGGRLVYQRAPGLRVHPPSERPLGQMHTDEEYHHQPSELNFWVPLTDCFGNNSLWIESEPDKGDFHPIELKYGEYCKFYGNKCSHFTHPNNTNSTRVSIDFRVVSSLSGGHDPDFHRGVRRGPKANFQTCFDVGGFYDLLDIPPS